MAIKIVTVDVLQERLTRGDRFQMIDLRSAGEYAAGHLPSATNLPLNQLESRLDDLHHRDPVLLICQSGDHAVLASEMLKARFRRANDLLVLDGGTAAWECAGLPLVRETVMR